MILEHITLNDVVKFVILMGSFVGALGILWKKIKDFLEQALDKSLRAKEQEYKEKINGFASQLNEIEKQLKASEAERCKSYLTSFLADVENGIEKTPEQIQQACSQYDHYIKDLGEDSYVKANWERIYKYITKNKED